MRSTVFKRSDYKHVPLPHPTSAPTGQFPSGAYVYAPTHGGVQYAAGGFKGSKVWVSASPFPGANDDYENPCVWRSDDTEYPPYNFTPYVNNPIIGKIGSPTSSSFNSDPDILIANSELYVFNRETWRGTDVAVGAERCEFWMYRGVFEGNDLVNFEPAIKMYSGYGTAYTQTNFDTYVSPSIIHDGTNFICIDIVSGSWNSALESNNTARIRKNTAVSLTENCFQTGWTDISFSGYKIEPWHMQVFNHNGKFYAIVAAPIRGYTGTDSGRIYLGEFDADLKNLYIHGRALTDFRTYRSAAYVDENGIFVLYACAFNDTIEGLVGKAMYVTSELFEDVLKKVKS